MKLLICLLSSWVSIVARAICLLIRITSILIGLVVMRLSIIIRTVWAEILLWIYVYLFLYVLLVLIIVSFYPTLTSCVISMPRKLTGVWGFNGEFQILEVYFALFLDKKNMSS